MNGNMSLIDANKLIEALDIENCNECRFGGSYCSDCKNIDAHIILDVIESLLKGSGEYE